MVESALGEFPSRLHQFGNVQANPQSIGGRRGVIISKAKKRQLRELHAMTEAIGAPTPRWEGDSLRLFQEIYRDPRNDLSLRLLAGRYAASYERATLSAVATVTPQHFEHGLAARLTSAMQRTGRTDDVSALEGEFQGRDE